MANIQPTIRVNEPVIYPEARTYVLDCLDTGWISSSGKYVKRFEEEFARFLDVEHAVSVTNGTEALHLALATLGIGAGDEIIIPDLTIISCAFAALYVGAKPVLVDVDLKTGNIDPLKIEKCITPRTKAIMVVHLYGQAADMDPIMKIARKHNLRVIEDAAEAHGATYKGKKVGSIGDIGCFSFYGNKIITTGEGGMILMHDDVLYEKASLLMNLSHKHGRRFYHEELGFNMRMTNMQAALGCAGLLHVKESIEKKIWMAQHYRELLSDIPWIELPQMMPYAESVFWMYTILLKSNAPIKRAECMNLLQALGVETRTYFYPLHLQPVLVRRFSYDQSMYPISTDLSERGLYLPSGLALTEEQIRAVSEKMHSIANAKKT
ncbi:MAG: DegT/DnrJ/EryC1/StrS family aminotransferase [Candidatus Pacebacteria bacterium]|nr:DegT/DnrJ/EryC1/StrS family aminotransferase [Candidatus Paceibacterota bacterium]